MGMNFPDVPVNGQVSGPYTWDGEKWVVTPGSGGSGLDQATADARYVNVSGDVMTGALAISATTTSTSPTTGALTVAGGVGITGNVFIGGSNVDLTLSASNASRLFLYGGASNYTLSYNYYIANRFCLNGPVGIVLSVDSTGKLDLPNAIPSSSPATGALTVAGGVGVTGTINVGSGTMPAVFSQISALGAGAISNISVNNTSGAQVEGLYAADNTRVIYGALTNHPVHIRTNNAQRLAIAATGEVNINSITASTSPATGALTVAGGVGVGGAINVGSGTTGTYYFGNSGTKDIRYDGTNFFVEGGGLFVSNFVVSSETSTTGHYYFGSSGTKYLQYDGTNFNLAGGPLKVADTTASSSPTTGALTVAGGAGVGGNLACAGIISSGPALTGGVLTGDIVASRNASSGAYFFGTAATRYLQYDGASFNLVGGPLILNGNLSVPAANFISTTHINSPSSNLRLDTASNALPILLDGSSVNISSPLTTAAQNIVGVVTHQYQAGAVTSAGYGHVFGWGGSAQWGMSFHTNNADSGNAIHFFNTANNAIGSIGVSAGSVTYNTTSDADLKEDLKSFDAGSIIDSTNVYDFKWKSIAERGFGVLAQQAVEIYPTAVTHNINPETKVEFWGVDYSKYVPVLLQELKALRARVAQLEGAAATRPA